MNHDLIEQYVHGGETLATAIRGLLPEDLRQLPAPDAPPRVGKWSIQQVLVHLADADLVMSERMKRVIAEDNPPLLVFDETRWAEHLAYLDQSAEDAVALLNLNRRQMARVLRQLPDAAWERFGTHSQAGRLTLLDVVRGTVEHLEHHLAFIHAKRARMGKALW